MKRLLVCLLLVISLSGNLQKLQMKYSWPEQKPNVNPDDHHMFANHSQLSRILNKNMFLIVELGSWGGAGSTRWILDHALNAVVIAIDHWKGSAEHQNKPGLAEKLPTLYETFLVNCWEDQHRLIPMKTTTIEGLYEIARHGLQPDMVYVDASHDFESVTNDLETIYRLFPNTLITGDDWIWGSEKNFPVRCAVIVFAQKYGFSIAAERNFWMIKK